MIDADVLQRLGVIRLLAMDVDGVLTRGEVTWGADPMGSLLELKTFNVKDGLGFGLVHSVGLRTAWITGRNSAIVRKRAAELGVREVCQNARDKRAALAEIMTRLGVEREEVLYVGDDLNDLPAFETAGVRVAVGDAVSLVRQRADWVTLSPGGSGAVREVMDTVLQAQGRAEEALEAFLRKLAAEHGTAPGQ